MSLRANNPQKNLPLPGLWFTDSLPNPQDFAAQATKPDAAPLPPTPVREIQPPLRADGAASASPFETPRKFYRALNRVEASNPDMHKQAGLTERHSIPPVAASLDSRCPSDTGKGWSAGPPSPGLPLSSIEHLVLLSRVNIVCFGKTLFPLLAMTLRFIAREQLCTQGLEPSSERIAEPQKSILLA